MSKLKKFYATKTAVVLDVVIVGVAIFWLFNKLRKK